MLLHYFKIALRNLRKYPAQTAISVLGLAAGFVCLSLSALWMHYENTYDTMHKDYERIYTFQDERFKDRAGVTGYGTRLLSSCAVYKALLQDFPEVEAAAVAQISEPTDAFFEGVMLQVLLTDSSFIKVFDIPLIEGDLEFLKRGDRASIALTESLAKMLLPGVTDYVGRGVILAEDMQLTVAAVYKPFDEHSIFAGYDMIMPNDFDWGWGWTNTMFAKLYNGVDVQSFSDKVYNICKENGDSLHTATIPLVQAHRYGGNYLSLRYTHLQNFALCSTLLVVCALINFLVLYLIRLRGRQREMALRIVNGATTRSLLLMFVIEYSMVLIAAVAIGALVIEWLREPFVRFASIGLGGYYIQLQSFYYMLGIAVVCLVVSLVPIAVVRHRTLHRSLSARQSGGVMRKASLFIQLTTSIAFIFCTIVMLRQVHFLRNNDWGYAIKGRAQLGIVSTRNPNQLFSVDFIREAEQKIVHLTQQMPMVTSVRNTASTINGMGGASYTLELSSSPDNNYIEATMEAGFWDIGHPDHGFTAIEGTLPREENWEENQIVITENIRRALGWDNAVGRTIYWRSLNGQYQDANEVVAVIKDIYDGSLMNQPTKYFFHSKQYYERLHGSINHPIYYITISYEPEMRKEFDVALKDMMNTHFPDIIYLMRYQEDLLAGKLKSETNLTLILSIITAVCILVAVFGVYSIVTLACAQRRKEIALRKIHGATLADILSIFIKEYGLIVLAASAVAFPIGYMIMKEWVAQYVKQAPIAWWIYAVILLAIVLLIALSVGSRVWRTARENPAEVIKSGN